MPGAAHFSASKALRLFICVFAIPLLLATTAPAYADGHDKWVKGRILVQVKAGVSHGRFKQLLAPQDADTAGTINGINTHIISVPQGAEERIIKALSRHPFVVSAEKDLYVQVTDFTPNDAMFSSAWHLQTMNLPGAWDISRGDDITVAVLDTGVNGDHEDLSGKMVSGRNVASNSPDTSDIHGHGTKVAGVIGAITHNEEGVASIAPNAWIMPIRITDDTNGWASTSKIAAGITWAADHGADIASISFESTDSSVVRNAADYMRSKGGMVVIAAGNGSSKLTTADSDSIISVSATTNSDTKASWSNYGNFIDVAAPGVSIWTTNRAGDYQAVSGTSFSTPATAATIALIMSVNPSLSPAEIEEVLENSAVDLGAPGFDPEFGHGRIDALAAVLLAGGQPTTPPDTEPPSVAFSSPQNGATVSGIITVNATASDNKGVIKVELFDDAGLVGTVLAAPYSFGWDSARSGEGSTATLKLVAHDSKGNTGMRTINVNVADTTPPVISAPGNKTVEATGTLTSVTLGSANATDNVDATVSVTPDKTGPFAIGSNVITWTASDAANNTATATQTITVRDTTPPAVTAPANKTVVASGTLTNVALGSATAIDLVDGSLLATPSPAGPFAVGVTVVNWQATDNKGNTGTATQLVTIIEPDSTPPQVSAPSNKTVEATGQLTAVNIGTATASDNEDGNLTATPDNTGPFPLGKTTITWTATDAEGNTATDTQRITVRDTRAPTLDIPNDISVGASGILTNVNLGEATAFDQVSGDITPQADPKGPFVSGRHAVTWTATDSTGNPTSATQMVTVLPRADFSLDQTVNEGKTVTVTANLSGNAAAYPVVVPYTVTGSANNPLDHNARDGEIRINSGTTGSLSFNVVDDGANGEPASTVVFNMQSPTNAVTGSRLKHTVTITEDNAPPVVSLLVEQQGIPVRTVYPFNGDVVVTADVSDPNSDDKHSFDWNLTDNRLAPAGGTQDREFILDPDQLAAGIYTLRVTVTDDGIPAESVSAEIVLNVVANPPQLSSSKDQDGDGKNDANEGLADSDQDGISDYLDAISNPSILQGKKGIADKHLLVTDPGLRLSLGATALAAGQASASVGENDIDRFGGNNGQPGANTDDRFEYTGGIFDFIIKGLTEPGQSVRIVLPQRVALRNGAVYRKYTPNSGWQDYVIDGNNKVASAPGSEGVCPAPGDNSYRSGLNTGDYCVQLTLQDGGPNDQDGLRNAVIHDPSAAGSLPQATGGNTGGGGSSGGGGGGGGGCTLDPSARMDPVWMVILLAAGIGIRRRRLRR